MEVSEQRLAVAVGLMFLLGVLFSEINGELAAETGSDLPIVVYAISFVSLAVGAFLVALFKWKIDEHQMTRILRVLPEDERRVLEILVSHRRIEQNHLVAMTGLSKVRVSRVTSKLEARGVLEKRQMGNTNLVILRI